MQKYRGKQIFTHGSFPKVKNKRWREKERKKERMKDGNNNGQLRIATSPRMAHASRLEPKQIFTHGSFPKVSQKQKTEEKRKRKRDQHISSSYAKILGEKLFRTWEIPQSGSKTKDGGKKRERVTESL